MFITRKRKTARNSSRVPQNAGSSSSGTASESVRQPNANNSGTSEQGHSQNGASLENSNDLGPYEYICIYRPFCDFQGENWMAGLNNPSAYLPDEDEVFEKLYMPYIEKVQKQNIFKARAADHPEHKWVIMWNALKKMDWLCRKAKYSAPEYFDMDLYQDWRGWGIQEIIENVMVDFDKTYRSKAPTRIEDMWVIVSAVGMWLNKDDHVEALLQNEHGEKTCELFGLIVCALLTMLSAIEEAGELKPDSRFLDLALVIGYYIEILHDLPAYGIEGDCMRGRKEVVNYFKKGNLDFDKALCTTRVHMQKLEKVDEYNEEIHEEGAAVTQQASTGSSVENPVEISENGDTEKDNTGPGAPQASPPPTSVKGKRKRDEGDMEGGKNGNKKKKGDTWEWTENFKKYKEKHGDGRGKKIGGTHYDITKMSRTERAEQSFDGVDPLADIPIEDLKNDRIDLDW